MTRPASKSGLRCTRVGSRLLCSLADVAKAAGVHRNAVYQAGDKRRLPVTHVFGVPATTKAAAVAYLKGRAARVARVKTASAKGIKKK